MRRATEALQPVAGHQTALRPGHDVDLAGVSPGQHTVDECGQALGIARDGPVGIGRGVLGSWTRKTDVSKPFLRSTVANLSALARVSFEPDVDHRKRGPVGRAGAASALGITAGEMASPTAIKAAKANLNLITGRR